MSKKRRHREPYEYSLIGNDNWAWGRIVDDVLDRDEHTCQKQHYGCLIRATSANHIVARVDGGGDELSNLEAICASCHDVETTELIQRLAKERAEVKKQLKRKNHPGRKDRYV